MLTHEHFQEMLQAKVTKIGNFKISVEELPSGRHSIRLLQLVNVPFLVGHVTLAPFPGCCGVCVITGLETYGVRGIAGILLDIAEVEAWFMQYTVAVATDVVGGRNGNGNTRVSEMLKRRGWTRGSSFKNRNSGNWVAFFEKKLDPEGIVARWSEPS